jgi:uncharacterized protein YndB with AHSA1/START domain
MKTVTVTRTINAPIEKVFDVLVDHANYKEFPGIRDSKLEKAGAPERNGVGALRHIDIGRGWFREEITHYERPRRLDYIIRETSLPLEHRGGSVRLEPVAGGTKVTWSTTIRVTTPLIGGLLTGLVGRQLQGAFGATLAATERRAAAA